ncbi:MFS transporter [Marinihelvus fidelis]|uniref:MFS transporter n=1 Tax=Marinihelvus fidelis TaxID=2613842 RepID=A0A5N0TF38_9GAMM|nr:MFS transporter [Marinihelvus fidelis]KAA9133231.1 MFS transporter [Marinihelvus fidelis]
MINKLSRNSFTSRIGLAFLATAGLFYVNIMPAIIDGLIEALDFSNRQAGAVGSANMYGAAFGALLIVFLVRRLNWRVASLAFLLTLIVIDLLSIGISQPTALVAMRFVHGLVGGMLVGTGFAVIARTEQPDRTFGVLLFVQFGLGGLGVMLIPGLVPQFGTAVLFLSLVAFSVVTLAMLPWLPDYAVSDRPPPPITRRAAWSLPLVLTLLAIFLFQGANMGLYAFIIGLGAHYGLEQGFITQTLGASAWIGLAGAGLVIAVSDRMGYLRPLTLGIGITAIATWALLYSDVPAIWIASNMAIGVTWAFTISYLLGLASRFDSHGQMAALAGFASKMGLASGPMLIAFLLGEDRYALVIGVSALALVAAMATTWIPARARDRAAD